MFDFEFYEPDILCQDSRRYYTSLIVHSEEHSISSCPNCATKMYRYGRYARKLKDMPLYPNPARMFIIKAQRYRCSECGFTLRSEQ